MIVTGPPPRRYPWEPGTIAQQLERTAARYPDRDALVSDAERLTWSQVRDAARRLAKGLLGRGIGRGDHVALWVPNHVEWPLTWLAATYTGSVIVPVNTRYKADEVRYILRQSDARLLVMVDRFLDIDYVQMLHQLCPPGAGGGLDTGGFPELGHVALTRTAVPGTETLTALAAAGDTMTDADLDAHAATVAWMPFFHVAGCLTGLLPGVISGAALVLLDHWDPGRALDLVAAERVSVLSGIPTHFIDLLNHPDLDRYDTSSLRTGWIGGASVPRAVVSAAIDRLGLTGLLPVYGMTETTSVTTFPRLGDPPEIVLAAKGLPVADFELKVVSVGSGEELGPDAEGEICVRGHLVMQGYYRKPEATAAIIDDDGWFRTGDLGVLDVDGYLSVTGRRSDMFIVGGSNAYPAEIEAALSAHEKIKQAYVVGVPDPRLGEVGFAFVELRCGERLSATDVTAFCRQRLADYKVPRFVRFVDEWPLTSTGKIQRFRLREAASAGG